MANEQTIAPPEQDPGGPPQTPAPQGQPAPIPAAKKLYDQLNKSQLYTKSFEDFQQQFSKPEAIDKLYQNLNGAKLYTKTKDDFYDQFFQAQKPAPEHQISHTPVQDVRHLNDLANQPIRSTTTTLDPMSGGSMIDQNQEDVARNKKYQEQYEKSATDLAGEWGTDPKLTKQALKDFPDEGDENKLKGFANLNKDNPIYYSRLKSANDIRMTIAKSGPDGVNDANVFNHLQTAANYEELQHNIAMQQEIMHKHGLGQAYFEKLKESQAPLINTLDPGLNVQYWNSDDKKLGLSDFQYAGLETEKLFNPGKYQQDKAIIRRNRGLDANGAGEANPVPQGKEGYAYDRGVENVLYALENQGRQNTAKFISQRSAELGPHIDDLASKYKQWISSTNDPMLQQHFQQEFLNDPLLQEAAKISEGQQSIEYAQTEDQRRFPLNYGDQASRLVKDAMSTTNGWGGVAGKQVLLGAGESADNTMRFIKNTYINLLGSDQLKAENAASNIGHQALTELAGYEGSAFSQQQSPLLLGDGLVKSVQDVFNNSSFSTEEKNQKATDLVLNHEGEIKVNPKAGQQNLSGKAGIYSAANTIGQIIGIADQSMLMGSLLGDAAKAQQMANAVTPMYASTQNQLYEQALARGDEHPLLSSHLDAAIISLASMINPDIKVVKGMVGAETGIGKLIAGVDESTWNKVLSSNKPLVDRMIAGTKATARQLGLANLQYGLLVPTAQYIVHKNVLNEDPNLGDAIKDGLLQTSITMALPSVLHGWRGWVGADKVNPMQKLAIVEAGLHPKENIELIDNLVEKGQITPDRADQIKEIIKHTDHILEHTDGVKSDGTMMTEQEVGDLTFQMLRKRVLEGKLKNAPDPQKPAMEEKIHEINQSIADLHTSDADKQKTDLNQLLTENLGRIKEKIPTMEGAVRESVKRNEPEKVFQEIYDQATQTKTVDGKEISSRAATEEIFGKELVQKAIDLHNEKTKTNGKADNAHTAQAGHEGQVMPEKPQEGAAPGTAEPAASSFHQSIAYSAQQALIEGKNKLSVVSDENGNPKVSEETFDKDDAATELDLLEGKAKKGKLKWSDFVGSFFGQNANTGDIMTAKAEFEKDPLKFIQDFRSQFEKPKEGTPAESKEPTQPASSFVPNSPKIHLLDKLRTWFLGDMEGKPEDEAAKKHIEGVVTAWDKHPAGETGGETFGQFINRVIPAFKEILDGEAHNTTVVTHSSVLKAFRVWDAMGRPDVEKLTPEKKKEFAEKYNATETHNGDLETFKGANGDIHVIRHGETEDNAKNNFRSGNTNLTEKGISDAQSAGQELKAKTGGDVPKILTSDLPRTIHSSNLINDAISERSPERQVPPTGTAGENIPSGSEGVGPGQQGEAPAPQAAGEGEGKEPPDGAGGQTVTAGGEPSQTGIAERVKKQREAAAGVKAPEPGTGLSVEAGIERGRKLLREGADPEKILEDYSEKKKGLIADDVSVVRARLEQLAKATDAAIEKYGEDSPEAEAARKAESDWAARIQPMQSDWAEIGRRQQGSTDLDTGTVTSIKRAFKEQSGKPLTEKQSETAQNLHGKIKEQETTISDLQKKLDEAHNVDPPKKTTKNYSKERKDSFQAARDALKKLRTGESGLGVGIPLVRELAAIAPHIGNIVTSYIAEGIDKLGDIVDKIHDELSGDMPGLRRRDIHDLIAGDYNKANSKLPNATEEKYGDLKKQARLIKKLEDLQNGLPEDFDKNRIDQSPEVKKLLEQIKKVKKDLDAMGYMTNPKAVKVPDTPEQKNIKRLEKQLEELQQGNYKYNDRREPSEKEKELKEQIFEAKKKLGVIPSKQLSPEEEVRIKGEKIAELATKFVAKKDNVFTPDEAKAIWEHAKTVMSDGTTDFHEVVKQVAMDTGLSTEQVRRAIAQPKGAKVITDKMYAAMYKRNQVIQQAKAWVKSADQSAAKKFWKAVIAGPSAIVTALHGSVAPITHVGADLYRPSNWKSYFNFMLNSYKYSFGGLTERGKARYEKDMGDLVRDPMFLMAKKAGLKCDPTDLSGDDYSKYQGIWGKLSKMGERGFNAMKPYRLEQFKKMYNGLSDQAKGNSDVIKTIADIANLSSGTTSVKTGKYTDLVVFAPKLVTSQYQRIFSEPAKAVGTFAKWGASLAAPNKVSAPTDAQKLQAKMVARHTGEIMATYMIGLAGNQAILTMTGSKQKINFTNPLDPDWMKFKVLGKDADASGGMNSSLRFVASLIEEGLRANGVIKTDEKGKPGDTEGRKILQQAANKLSPLAGDIKELFSTTDNGGNPLPWSSVKAPAGRAKLTWAEYFESKSPIFISEGFKAFNDGAKSNGMPDATFNDYLEGVIIGVLAGTTGAHISPEIPKKSAGGRRPEEEKQ